MIDDVIYTMLIVVAFIINMNLIYHFVRTVIRKHERGWVSHFKMGLETIMWLIFIVMSIGILEIYHGWLDTEKMNIHFEGLRTLWILFIQLPIIVMNIHMSARWMRVMISYVTQKKDTPYNRLLKSQHRIDSINGGDEFIKALNHMCVSDVEQLQTLDCITETNIMRAILYDDIQNKAVKEALKLKIIDDVRNKQGVKKKK